MDDKDHIVWNPDSKLPPTRRMSKGEAVKCAAIMAKKNPGKEFFVCHLVGVARTEKVVYTSLG